MVTATGPLIAILYLINPYGAIVSVKALLGPASSSVITEPKRPPRRPPLHLTDGSVVVPLNVRPVASEDAGAVVFQRERDRCDVGARHRDVQAEKPDAR